MKDDSLLLVAEIATWAIIMSLTAIIIGMFMWLALGLVQEWLWRMLTILLIGP